MWQFYLLAASILILGGIINTESKKGAAVYLGIVFSFFAFLLMFKAPSVGNDTETYIKLFKEIASYDKVSNFLMDSRYEAGFVYIIRIISKLFDDPQYLFILTGPFIAFSFGRFIYKYSRLPWMSVYMFLTLQFFDLSFSGLRQIISIAVLLFSYDFLIKRRPIQFFSIVFIAATIHTSAVLFLLLYPFTSLKQTRNFYLISTGIGIAGAVSFGAILRVAENVFPQYLKYFTQNGTSFKSSPTLACALMLVLWLTLLIISELFKRGSIFRKAPEIAPGDAKIILHSTSVDDVLRLSIWFGIIMLMLSLNGTILNRFKYVFTVPIITYYPSAIADLKLVKNRALMYIGSCAVFMLYILIIYTYRPDWQSTFPYSFFWQVD